MSFIKYLSILGSTGSIGRQALEIVDMFPEKFQVVALAAGGNMELFRQQIKKYRPSLISVRSKEDAARLATEMGNEGLEVLWGLDGLLAVATFPKAQTILTAVTGTIGLVPTVAAIKAGKDIALANKETLVAAGSVVMDLAQKQGIQILPVDSEHSAVWQCIRGGKAEEVDSILLTASGGPFREQPQDLNQVTVEMTLKHPNWNMGHKITVDSATLMNKGLEVIEARWLFGLDYDRIRVVVHPQSIIHSMVEFVDGSVLAQLGLPDMKLPIQYALGYPDRLTNNLPRLDWHCIKSLTFEPPNTVRFPLLELAYQAGRLGGTAPAVLNAANEVAVDLFLNRKIRFTSIYPLVEEVVSRHRTKDKPDLDDILEADQGARISAREISENL